MPNIVPLYIISAGILITYTADTNEAIALIATGIIPKIG